MIYDEKQIAHLMKTLDITREEAIQVIKDDDDIDHGIEKDFDLSAEQEKIAKQMKNVKRAVDAYGKKRTVTKKVDTEKENLIKQIFDFLATITEDTAITNSAKTIDFKLSGNAYTVTLTKHREKKGGN